MIAFKPGRQAQFDLWGTRSNMGQGFSIFGFGDATGGYSNTPFSRKYTFSNSTESSNSDFTTGKKIVQGTAFWSSLSSKVYLISGYTGSGLDTNVNTQAFSTNTQSTISNSWMGVVRRGTTAPGQFFGIRFDASSGSCAIMGGYSDNTGLYYARIDYLQTFNETGGYAGDNTFSSHVGISFASYENYYYAGGYESITTMSKRNNTTGSVSTLAATDTAGYYGYGTGNWGYGYRFGGTYFQNYSNTMRFNYYNETRQTGTSLPSTQPQFSPGTTGVSNVFAYLWTGYRGSTLNRFLNLYSWSTDTFTDASYTTGDTNNGWIYATGGT